MARERPIKEDCTLGRYPKTSLGTLPRPIGVFRASICVSVVRWSGGCVASSSDPNMSPPPNLLIRGGASWLEEHVSQSVSIQRTGRYVTVWCEWQRVHTIGQYEPSLAAFVTRNKNIRGSYLSESPGQDVSCACADPRTR